MGTTHQEWTGVLRASLASIPPSASVPIVGSALLPQVDQLEGGTHPWQSGRGPGLPRAPCTAHPSPVDWHASVHGASCVLPVAPASKLGLFLPQLSPTHQFLEFHFKINSQECPSLQLAKALCEGHLLPSCPPQCTLYPNSRWVLTNVPSSGPFVSPYRGRALLIEVCPGSQWRHLPPPPHIPTTISPSQKRHRSDSLHQESSALCFLHGWPLPASHSSDPNFLP